MLSVTENPTSAENDEFKISNFYLKSLLTFLMCAMAIFSIGYFMVDFAAMIRVKKPILEEPKSYYNFMVIQTFPNSMGENREAMRLSVNESCDFDPQQVPKPDIQMLDLYNNMSFVDLPRNWKIQYDTLKYNDDHILKVFVVLHSGYNWEMFQTYDEFYYNKFKTELYNILSYLHRNPDMKFIWADISQFSRFYEDLCENKKLDVQKIVNNGQLEFVTGGWVISEEANTHWQNLLLQLTEGQHWLKKHLNHTPISSWSTGPFGYSPSMPYILKKSGFENTLIEQANFLVKWELALKRNFEFYWRQLWDNIGDTDVFTHIVPFGLCDIDRSHNPNICNIFHRLTLFDLSEFTPEALRERAEIVVDHWKKKAELFRTNVLLYPLNFNFFFSDTNEGDENHIHLKELFSHINRERKYFIKAEFGTLQEYFDAVHQEQKEKNIYFPTISGDFFTFADHTVNYWSGYYTGHSYHKRMDRIFMHYIRSAEMLSSWHHWDASMRVDKILQEARRQLSLFQYDDTLMNAAKPNAIESNRMLDAIISCKFVMQQSVYRLLSKPSIYKTDSKFNVIYLDDYNWPGLNNYRKTIKFNKEIPQKHLVFHNSLAHWREEIIDFYISLPFVSVRDSNNNSIDIQINPVWIWHKDDITCMVTPKASTTKYRLIFKVKVPPLGLSTYVVKSEMPEYINNSRISFASNLIMTTDVINIPLGDYPKKVDVKTHHKISLQVGSGPRVSFTSSGMMKSIQTKESESDIPIKVKFFKYRTIYDEDLSADILIQPNETATPIVNAQTPIVLVTEGPLESSVSVGLSIGIHHTIIRENEAPEIHNNIYMNGLVDTEIVMRVQTLIRNGEIFYTDLNGLQIIKRQRFSKIPLRSNYYSISSAIYIEDDAMRLTLVSAQTVGGSSLAEGKVEIMQDRHFKYGDNRPVLFIFRIVLERIDLCEKFADNHPAGALTLAAHRNSHSLLYPLDKFIFLKNDLLDVLPDFGSSHSALGDDMEIVNLRNLHSTLTDNNYIYQNTGLIVHRTILMQCSGQKDHNTGKFNLLNLLQWNKQNVSTVYKTTLTFLKRLGTQNIDDEISLCSMDTLAFVIELQRQSRPVN